MERRRVSKPGKPKNLGGRPKVENPKNVAIRGYVEKNVAGALREIARATGESESMILRRAVLCYLQAVKEQLALDDVDT